MEELNERFWRWLEEDYHRRVHSSLEGKTPHEVFHSQFHEVSFLEDTAILETIFLKREHRKVKPDGTITLNKQLYEVPPRFIGQPVDVRFDEQGVFIFENDQKVAEAIPVSFKVNAQAKRVQSPFLLSGSTELKEGEENV